MPTSLRSGTLCSTVKKVHFFSHDLCPPAALQLTRRQYSEIVRSLDPLSAFFSATEPSLHRCHHADSFRRALPPRDDPPPVASQPTPSVWSWTTWTLTCGCCSTIAIASSRATCASATSTRCVLRGCCCSLREWSPSSVLLGEFFSLRRAALSPRCAKAGAVRRPVVVWCRSSFM